MQNDDILNGNICSTSNNEQTSQKQGSRREFAESGQPGIPDERHLNKHKDQEPEGIWGENTHREYQKEHWN